VALNLYVFIVEALGYLLCSKITIAPRDASPSLDFGKLINGNSANDSYLAIL
jgi:hypothetical protein